MARFFGRNKNQAEMDFRRFEREIYINSSQKPSSHPPQEEEVYYQDYDTPSFGPRLSSGRYSQENREFPKSSQAERQTPLSNQPSLRPNSGFRNASHPSQAQAQTQENSYYRLSSSPNYRTQDYRQASRQDELKGLSFWQDGEEATDEGSEEWAERPSPFKFIIALLGLTLMISIIWFGYRWLSQPAIDNPPLIQAESGPFKIKPENPGGASIPYQDKLIYGRISNEEDEPVERLLPSPEQPDEPSAIEQQDYTQPVYPPQTIQNSPSYPNYNQTVPVYQAPAYQTAQGIPLPPQPPASQNVPDQQPAHPSSSASYPPHQPYPTQGTTQGMTQGAAVPNNHYPHHPGPANEVSSPQLNPVPAQSSIPYTSLNGTAYPSQPYTNPNQSLPNQQPASNEKVAAIREENQDHHPTSSPIKGVARPLFYCQLGTLPTENAAQQELDRLRKRYNREVNNSEGSVREFKSPEGKKNYRVLLGPFKTRNIALSKCNKLGSSCRVVPLT